MKLNTLAPLNRWPAALLAAALLCAACDNASTGASQPVDEGAIRPNSSRKIKVGFGTGSPSTIDTPVAAAPTHDPGMMAQQDEAPASDLAWTAPSAWTSTKPSSQMRLAQYVIPRAKGDSEDGELAVFHLGLAGGGVDETFRRWESAFDEDAIKAAKRSDRKAGDLAVSVIDIGGKYRADSAMMAIDAGATTAERQGMRLLGAIVTTPEGPYYFKLLGPDKTISAAREDFFKLLDSCKMNN